MFFIYDKTLTAVVPPPAAAAAAAAEESASAAEEPAAAVPVEASVVVEDRGGEELPRQEAHGEGPELELKHKKLINQFVLHLCVVLTLFCGSGAGAAAVVRTVLSSGLTRTRRSADEDRTRKRESFMLMVMWRRGSKSQDTL